MIGDVGRVQPKGAFCSWGEFFWDYSGYSYHGLGITEYKEFHFQKNSHSF